jgi:O-antigen/teichoic acid export membrane protein
MRRVLPIALSQVALLGFGILGIKLVTVWVPVEVYRSYALFLTLTQLGCLLTHSGLLNHATRYWQREKAQGGGYAKFLWRQSWRLAAPLALVIVLTSVIVEYFVAEWSAWEISLLLFISNMGFVLWTLSNQALNADEQHWRLLALGLVASVTRAVLPVGMVCIAGASLLALNIGFAAHGLVIIVVSVCFFLWARHAPAPASEVQAQWRLELKDFGRPFIFMGIGAWILLNIDRWVVALRFDEQKGGLFAMASSIAFVVPSLTSGVLMQGFFPRIFRQADQAKSADDWRRLAWRCDQLEVAFLTTTLVGLVALTWILPLLVPWLIADKYAAAAGLILPTGAALAVLASNQFYYLLLQGQHNSASMAKVMMVVSGLKFVGTLFAALISWNVLLVWLVLSLIVSALLGRFLIRRIALRHREPC